MARVYADTRALASGKVVLPADGAQPDDQQRWTKYGTSVLAFSAISVLFLYGLLLVQTRLPEPWGHKGMTPALAFNTAISFVTNTSWQNYPGETTLGHVGLLAGLGVQAFASCAVGMCVAAALIRGLARYQSERDRQLLGRPDTNSGAHPGAVVDRRRRSSCSRSGWSTISHGAQDITTLTGGSQTIVGGPVASWESIKLMSGDGGGAFNVNSAHPFENPTPSPTS